MEENWANNNQFKVSVVTPVHNAAAYITNCLQSVQAQTYSNWEHLLVDDCSQDQSADIIKSYAEKDNRVRYIRLSTNMGAGVARNTAIEAATGDFIAFLDSDDTWYPEKIEKQLAFMIFNNYPFTFTSYDTMNESGEKLQKVFKAKEKVTYKSALYKNPIGCLTAMYDIRYYGKEYMPEIRKRQDFALWLKLLKKSDGYGLQEVMASYRDASNSISSNKLDLLKYEWRIYREVEGLSILRSVFYLCSAVFLKLRTYFK